VSLTRRLDDLAFGTTPGAAGLLSGLMLAFGYAVSFDAAIVILLSLITLGVWHPD
jgi:hypothetical protein